MPVYQTGFQTAISVQVNICRVLEAIHRIRLRKEQKKKVLFFVDLSSAYDRVRRLDVLRAIASVTKHSK